MNESAANQSPPQIPVAHSPFRPALLTAYSMSSSACFSEAARAIIDEAKVAKDSSGAGSLGITTYISRVLRNGYGAYRHFSKEGPFKSSAGLRIGRKCDVEFQHLVKDADGGAILLGKCSPRIRGVGRLLLKQGIRVVGTQIPVHMKLATGEVLKTRLDGLGYLPKTQTFVVLELKTTQRSYASHLKTYKSPCRCHPEMTNGLENSEWTSHMLQTGFGAAAFRKRFAFRGKVAGLVIVSTSDGKTAGYHVPAEFLTAQKLVNPPSARDIPGGSFQRRSDALTSFDGRDSAVTKALSR